MQTEFDAIVIGLGGLGSAATYWLTRNANTRVLGLEQFEIGHVRGASQDHSRIIRLSYHTPAYVRLAQRAYQSWAEVEANSGQQIVIKTGGLDFAPIVGAAYPLDDYINSMSAVGVPFEKLSAQEIMRRWSPFRLDENVHGIYQPESGIACAAIGNAAHQKLARQQGAILRDNSPVRQIRNRNGEVQVTTADGTNYSCEKLILCADAWSNQLLAHFDLSLPLTVTQEQVTYFASPNVKDFMPERFPVWIWMTEPSFYGFPVFGENGPKAAQDVGGLETTADTRDFAINPGAKERLYGFLERYIPSMLGAEIYTKTCLYTLPPDRDFVLDALPGNPNVFIALGAAHAYKFASVIGRILSELALTGSTPSDISAFSYQREILHTPNAPKSFQC